MRVYATVLGSLHGSWFIPLSSWISCVGNWEFQQAGWVCIWPLDSQPDFYAYVGNFLFIDIAFY